MRPLVAFVGLAALASAAALAPWPAAAQCSVFARHPCAPATCGAFHRGPCRPDYGIPIGQDLRLQVTSEAGKPAADESTEPPQRGEKPEHEIDTLRQLFAALRACWIPPHQQQDHGGMSLSVRFAFRRDGAIIGKPQVTYENRKLPDDVREQFHSAVTAALDRCTPMPFSKGLGSAIAGRPINIRFIDDRT